MQKTMMLGACLALLPAVAAAQYVPYNPYAQPQPSSPYSSTPQTRSTYDWQTNSRYTTTRQPDGSTTVRGQNYNTGSTWRSTIQPNGDQRGTDSNGNTWRYNNSTGSYSNTDGTFCTGKGYARVCN